MTCIWTSDIHLDGSPKNEYRYDILPWLETTALAKKVDFVGINGDLTEAKDKHPASVVNRIVEFFYQSKNQWVINTGNHDFSDPTTPFFGFLKNFENVRWIRKPTSIMLPICADMTRTLILPSTKEWDTLWPPYFEKNKSYPYIFVHATFEGTFTETGHKLSGVPVNFFPRDQYGRVFAGDIHMPGTITRRMDYIGSPHRVYFGDTFDPRVLYFSKGEIRDIHPGMRSRHVLVIRKESELSRFEDEVRAGDQVKIRVRLRRSDFADWAKLRRGIEDAASQRGWEVFGVELLQLTSRARLDDDAPKTTVAYQTPKERLLAFAEARNLSEAETNFGLALLEG
jgi:DNA repair exonuclease SbcCD nuclease subunit